jgi:hypothetical protein
MQHRPERALQAPLFRRGQGAQCRRKYLAGKRHPVGGKLQIIGDIRDIIQHWLVDDLEFYA